MENRLLLHRADSTGDCHGKSGRDGWGQEPGWGAAEKGRGRDETGAPREPQRNGRCSGLRLHGGYLFCFAHNLHVC